MGRTGHGQNEYAQQEAAVQADRAFAGAQTAIGNVVSGEKTLERGGQIGANPYLNPQYLASVNRLQAGSLHSENEAAKNQLQALNRRTGGMNSTATTGAIRDLALQKMRLADTLSSQRTAQDWRSNLLWQQQLLRNRAMPAEMQLPFYQTATGLREGALRNLTDMGLAAYGPWMSAIQAAGGAASAAAGKPPS